jgi:hypothetical protein
MKINFILYLFISMVPLFAQWTLERETFIPPEYYVGDLVKLELVYKLEESLELKPQGEIPKQDWINIENIQVNQQNNKLFVSIKFRSFYPGTRTLPSFDIGGYELQGISIFTSSVSEQEGLSEIKGLRDPIQLPGSHLLLIMLLIALVLVPFLLFYLLGYAYRKIKAMVALFKRKAPFRRFSRLMVQLQQHEVLKDARSFYTRLSVGLRSYLTDRTQVDYNSCTTRDMVRKKINGIDRTQWKKIIDIFKIADMVKYAGEDSPLDEMEKNLLFLQEVAQHWEEDEKNAYL